ncbi:MAG TPA: anti-sigma factor [Chloroflexota bacterium]
MSERNRSHETIEDLSGVAALRALTPDEARFVAAHLAGCASCRRQYVELAAVAELLLRVPEPVEPPAGLRERILALAAQTPQEGQLADPRAEGTRSEADRGETPPTGAPSAAAPPAGAPPPEAGSPTTDGGPASPEGTDRPPAGRPAGREAASARPPVPLAPRAPRRFDWRDLGLVASLAAALFFGYSSLRLRDELDARSARLAQVEPIANAAARGRTAPVAGTDAAPQIHGAVAEIDGRAQLYLEQLPSPPADRLYQVWLIPPGGQPIGVGVGSPGEGGTQTIPLDRPLAGMRLIAVTLEPAPLGSEGPTSEIFAAGTL